MLPPKCLRCLKALGPNEFASLAIRGEKEKLLSVVLTLRSNTLHEG